MRRAFEPSSMPFRRLPANSIRIRIHDLSALAPLLEPGVVVSEVLPRARNTRHALFVHIDEEHRVYVPAMLLLRLLWMWTDSTPEVLMTPNSLTLGLQRGVVDGKLTVEAAGSFMSVGRSDTSLRRLCWLAQSSNARASWASVLTFAHEGKLGLRLPSASLDAWAWGVETQTGLLVAELSAPYLQFELSQEDCDVKLGRAQLRCPPAARRPTGLVSF